MLKKTVWYLKSAYNKRVVHICNLAITNLGDILKS